MPGGQLMGYALQQLTNGLTLGCTYALLAMGLSLVMGVINRINLAHGEIFMVTAFYAALAFLTVGLFHLGSIVAVLLISLVAAALCGAAANWALNRIVFRPLRRSPNVSALIATIGVVIVLQESTRLLQGAGNFWQPEVIGGGIVIAGSDGFVAIIGYRQLLIMLVTAVVLGAYWRLIERTPFGRAQRAVAHDPDMAALLGINVDRVLAASFATAGVFAGIAGFVFAFHYGVVNFVMGFVLGLKAFTAAVLGGIGSLAGAALGGLVLAMIETFWSAYFPIEYRDVVTFGVLISVIVLRPEGILGRPLPDAALAGFEARRH
jgi:branched-chain amino acid transport system permease protein